MKRQHHHTFQARLKSHWSLVFIALVGLCLLVGSWCMIPGGAASPVRFTSHTRAAAQSSDETPQAAFNRKADKLLKHIYRLTAAKAGVAPESIAIDPEIKQLSRVTGIKNRGDAALTIGVMVSLAEGNNREIEELTNAGFETGARIGDIVSVETTPERLPALAALNSVRAMQATRRYHKSNDRARQAVGVDNTSGQRVVSQTGNGVVFGIVDTGIDFRHGDFLVPGTSRTRIKALWDITDPRNDFVLPGTTFHNGHMYTEADINNALANPSNTSIVQETDTDGHGSHVTGTAAGNGRGGTAPAGLYAGMAPEADLVIVKGGNGSFNDDDIASGLEFIRQQAAALNEPFVINLSLGKQIGAHDGTEPLERAIDTIVGSGVGRAVCVAAGDEGNAGIHADGTVPTGGSLTLNLQVNANPSTIDLYSAASDRYTVTVTSPDGVTLGPVAYDPTAFANPNPQASNQYLVVFNTNDDKGDSDPNNDQPDIFIIFKAAAANVTGNWTIKLQDADGNPNSGFDAWAQGDDLRFTNNVDNNAHLVSSPGTARNAITVGAYVTRSASLPVGSIAPFSNAGPTADGRLKPEITAPGFYLYSTRSADAGPSIFTYGSGANAVANNDTQHYGGLAGTSMSTPVVAGSIALILQANRNLSSYQIRDYLTRFATKDNFTNSDPPNGLTNNTHWTPHFGFGKLNVAPIINAITGATPNQINDSIFFVTQQYLDFLNRDPDSPGLAFWTNQITSCGSDAQCIAVRRINVSAAFFLSREFQETGFYVIKLQRAAFGKLSVDPTKRITFQQFLTDSRTVGNGFVDLQPGADQVIDQNKTAYAQSVAGSAAFITRYPTTLSAAGYVDALYATAGVTPQGTERQDAINAFGSGDTIGRAATLRKIAEANSVKSAEFNTAFVLMQYFGYLRRNPTDAPDFNDSGYQFWLNKLNSFGGDFIRSEMVKSFIVSGEYRQRFGQ